MEVGKRIKKFREKKNLSTTDLSRLTGISQSTISKLENGKRKPELSVLEKIAEALNILVDRLTGESASALIEDGLEKKGMTLEDVANKANVPLYWLQNLDTFTPGEWGGKDDIAYNWITKVAEVISVPGNILRAALARQEAPTYDGPMPTAEETFVKESISSYNCPKNTIERVIVDDPDLFEFFQELKQREDLQLMFKQTKDLSSDSIRRIIKYIKMVEDEESKE